MAVFERRYYQSLLNVDSL